jgi:transposase
MENLSKGTDVVLGDEELLINTEDTDENLKIKRQLLRERRTRIMVMSLLLSALLFTVIFGTLENPIEYTFSKIGNRFNNRILFIIWALFTGVTIQFSVIQLFRLERYSLSKAYKYILISSFFLIFSSLAPALDETYPIWTWIHIIAAGLFMLFLTLSIAPFMKFVSKENPRLRLVIKIWTGIIWGGSVFWMIVLGNTGIFELWGFGSVLIFLLYLSLTLFEERIVKQSIKLLKGEQDLNLGIESIFVNWEKLLKKKNKKS